MTDKTHSSSVRRLLADLPGYGTLDKELSSLLRSTPVIRPTFSHRRFSEISKAHESHRCNHRNCPSTACRNSNHHSGSGSSSSAQNKNSWINSLLTRNGAPSNSTSHHQMRSASAHEHRSSHSSAMGSHSAMAAANSEHIEHKISEIQKTLSKKRKSAEEIRQHFSCDDEKPSRCRIHKKDVIEALKSANAKQKSATKHLQKQKDALANIEKALQKEQEALDHLTEAVRSCRKDLFLPGVLGLKSGIHTNTNWTQAHELNRKAMVLISRARSYNSSLPSVSQVSFECPTSMKVSNVLQDSSTDDICILQILEEAYRDVLNCCQSIASLYETQSKAVLQARDKLRASRLAKFMAEKELISDHTRKGGSKADSL